MYCRICGKSIPEDSRFCPYCGQKVVLAETDSPSESVNENKDEPCAIIPLKLFAQENGKMQLCKAATTDGNLIRYILFTKETKVLMSSDTFDYSSTKIKEMKDKLFVHRLEDGSFVLELNSSQSHNKG